MRKFWKFNGCPPLIRRKYEENEILKKEFQKNNFLTPLKTNFDQNFDQKTEKIGKL